MTNFLFIVADQLRADAVGAFGSCYARTPNIDRLAAAGTVFSDAHVQHPVCAPSRVSLLTGWYPHVRGHRSLSHLLRPNDPNLLRYLKEAGSHVAHMGERGDTFAPGASEVSCHEYGFLERPAPRPAMPGDSGPLARAFYAGVAEEPDGGVDFDEAAVRTAETWLASPPDRPWALYLPMIAPHPPFSVAEPWFSMHDRDSMPDPMPRPDGHEPRYMAAIRKRYGTDRVRAEQWREVIATYAGMVSRFDWHVGRVLDALSTTAATDDTVVVLLSDHGEYLGDYGLVEKWPSGLHDCLTRTPLVMAGPGIPRGQTRDAPVEAVDVLPTVLDLAGLQARHTQFGRSLLPLLADPEHPHRRYAFSEGGFTLDEEPLLERAAFPYDLKAALQHEEPALVGKAVAVRSREWTYVWRRYEPPELYHRATDPGELVNVAGESAHASVEAQLRDAVFTWMVDTADVMPWEPDPRLPDVDLPVPSSAKPCRPVGCSGSTGTGSAGHSCA